jgi:hypothetical protein
MVHLSWGGRLVGIFWKDYFAPVFQKDNAFKVWRTLFPIAATPAVVSEARIVPCRPLTYSSMGKIRWTVGHSPTMANVGQYRLQADSGKWKCLLAIASLSRLNVFIPWCPDRFVSARRLSCILPIERKISLLESRSDREYLSLSIAAGRPLKRSFALPVASKKQSFRFEVWHDCMSLGFCLRPNSDL